MKNASQNKLDLDILSMDECMEIKGGGNDSIVVEDIILG